jgi:hypothetical protein
VSDIPTPTSTPEWVVRLSQEEWETYEARMRAENEEGRKFLENLPPVDYDIRCVEGMDGAEVDVEEWEQHSTSTHFVHVEVSGWHTCRMELDTPCVNLTPEQAVELGVLLIEAGRNTLRKNKK